LCLKYLGMALYMKAETFVIPKMFSSELHLIKEVSSLELMIFIHRT
jgi:hypothetical protein